MQRDSRLAVPLGVLPTLIAILAGVSMGSAHAQIPPQHQVYAFVGQPSDGLWGVNAGDVNKDGVPDIVMSASGRTIGGGIFPGAVEVYSGKDGRILHTFNGAPKLSQGHGVSVAAAGDVNKDGYGDIVAGTHDPKGDSSWYGAVTVYSGKDGRVRFKADGMTITVTPQDFKITIKDETTTE